jgi:hypothetical protein
MLGVVDAIWATAEGFDTTIEQYCTWYFVALLITFKRTFQKKRI